jgi:type IV pilus assembly protein PilC
MGGKEPASDGSRSRLPFKAPTMMARTLKANALAVFYRSLSTMLASGVRIDRSLLLLGRQEDDPRMAEVCRSLYTQVNNGKPLSVAMSQWGDIFSTLEQRLVQVGEMTGNIDAILDRLAAYEESRRRIAMRVQSALTYPLFIFTLAIIALVLMPPYLFGGLFKLIENFGVEIPLLTRIVLFFAKIVSSPIFAVIFIGGLIAAVRLVPGLLARPDYRLALSRFGLRLPVVGASLRTIAVTRFARAMEIMLNCGINIDQALHMSFTASANPVLIERLPAALNRLRSGATLREVLADTEFFSNGFLSMVSIGEESGKLPTLLSRIAQMYEMELGYTLETLVAALEPIMLLIMGILVGFFIIATMLPMMQVIRTL